MKISFGVDMRLNVVDKIFQILREQNHELMYYGPEKGDILPWPQIARQVAEDVAAGRSEEGILLCWTGTGVSIAANKVPGVRAALCFDAETARGARMWNDANVLCLSMRLTSEIMAEEILEKWFATKFVPNETDSACLAMVDELDGLRKG